MQRVKEFLSKGIFNQESRESLPTEQYENSLLRSLVTTLIHLSPVPLTL